MAINRRKIRIISREYTIQCTIYKLQNKDKEFLNSSHEIFVFYSWWSVNLLRTLLISLFQTHPCKNPVKSKLFQHGYKWRLKRKVYIRYSFYSLYIMNFYIQRMFICNNSVGKQYSSHYILAFFDPLVLFIVQFLWQQFKLATLAAAAGDGGSKTSVSTLTS